MVYQKGIVHGTKHISLGSVLLMCVFATSCCNSEKSELREVGSEKQSLSEALAAAKLEIERLSVALETESSFRQQVSDLTQRNSVLEKTVNDISGSAGFQYEKASDSVLASLESGDPDKFVDAEAGLRDFIEKYPKHELSALASKRLRELTGSRDSFAKALVTSGYDDLEAGRIEDARRHFDKAHQISPNYKNATDGLKAVNSAWNCPSGVFCFEYGDKLLRSSCSRTECLGAVIKSSEVVAKFAKKYNWYGQVERFQYPESSEGRFVIVKYSITNESENSSTNINWAYGFNDLGMDAKVGFEPDEIIEGCSDCVEEGGTTISATYTGEWVFNDHLLRPGQIQPGMVSIFEIPMSRAEGPLYLFLKFDGRNGVLRLK